MQKWVAIGLLGAVDFIFARALGVYYRGARERVLLTQVADCKEAVLNGGKTWFRVGFLEIHSGTSVQPLAAQHPVLRLS